MVDAGEAEHGRQQIGMAREGADLSRRAVDRRTCDDERDVRRLLIGVVPFLVHAAMRPEQVAMV